MNNSSTEKIVQGIKEQNEKIFLLIYQKYFPHTRSLVKLNKGCDSDAEDIFQEALIIVYTKIKNGDLKLKCSFSTYLYSVSRFLWLKELEKRKRRNVTSYQEMPYIELDNDIIERCVENERRKLYLKHFYQLSEACQRLLTLFIQGISIKEITAIMGYSTDQHTKNRRYRCKKSLIDKIRNDPDYRELKNEKYKENSKIPRW